MKKILMVIVSMIIGAGGGYRVAVLTTERKKQKELQNAWNLSNKHLALFKMMNDWVRLKQDGKNLADYFIKNDYKTIAIYGMSYAGQTLVNELKGTNIEVKYGIDKSVESRYLDIEVYKLEDAIEQVDAIVVTPITFFREIEDELGAIFDCPIISLEDVLYEID